MSSAGGTVVTYDEGGGGAPPEPCTDVNGIVGTASYSYGAGAELTSLPIRSRMGRWDTSAVEQDLLLPNVAKSEGDLLLIMIVVDHDGVGTGDRTAIEVDHSSLPWSTSLGNAAWQYYWNVTASEGSNENHWFIRHRVTAAEAAAWDGSEDTIQVRFYNRDAGDAPVAKLMGWHAFWVDGSELLNDSGSSDPTYRQCQYSTTQMYNDYGETKLPLVFGFSQYGRSEGDVLYLMQGKRNLNPGGYDSIDPDPTYTWDNWPTSYGTADPSGKFEYYGGSYTSEEGVLPPMVAFANVTPQDGGDNGYGEWDDRYVNTESAPWDYGWTRGMTWGICIKSRPAPLTYRDLVFPVPDGAKPGDVLVINVGCTAIALHAGSGMPYSLFSWWRIYTDSPPGSYYSTGFTMDDGMYAAGTPHIFGYSAARMLNGEEGFSGTNDSLSLEFLVSEGKDQSSPDLDVDEDLDHIVEGITVYTMLLRGVSSVGYLFQSGNGGYFDLNSDSGVDDSRIYHDDPEWSEGDQTLWISTWLNSWCDYSGTGLDPNATVHTGYWDGTNGDVLWDIPGWTWTKVYSDEMYLGDGFDYQTDYAVYVTDVVPLVWNPNTQGWVGDYFFVYAYDPTTGDCFMCRDHPLGPAYAYDEDGIHLNQLLIGVRFKDEGPCP